MPLVPRIVYKYQKQPSYTHSPFFNLQNVITSVEILLVLKEDQLKQQIFLLQHAAWFSHFCSLFNYYHYFICSHQRHIKNNNKPQRPQ